MLVHRVVLFYDKVGIFKKVLESIIMWGKNKIKFCQQKSLVWKFTHETLNSELYFGC
jgi:hypothetical protein